MGSTLLGGTYPRASIAGLLFCAIAGTSLLGCKKSVALFCDSNEDCIDVAGRPFCDLNGTEFGSEGISNTCVPQPADGGVDNGPDASPDDFRVTATTPANAGAEIEPTTTVSVEFSLAVDPATVTNSTIVLTDEVGTIVRGSTAVSSTADNTLEFTPEQPLALLARYTGTIAAELASKSGTAIAATPDWQFTIREGAWQPAQLVEENNTSSVNSIPQLGSDSAGNIVLSWLQNDGIRRNLWTNRYSASSQQWMTARIAEQVDANIEFVSTSVAASGDAVLLWSQQAEPEDAQLWAQTFDPTAGWSVSEQLDRQTGSVGELASSIDANGNAVILWTQNQGVNTETQLWARDRPTGQQWGAAGQLRHNGGGVQSPKVTHDRFGNALALWHENLEVCSARAVQPFGFDDALFVGFSTEVDGKSPTGDIGVDAAGNRIATWVGLDAGVPSVYWSRWTPSNGWSRASLLESDNAGPATIPSTAVTASGDATVVWIQDSGLRNNLWWSRFDQATVTWSAPTLLDSGAGTVLPFPTTLVADARGNTFVAWTQRQNDKQVVLYSRYLDSWSPPKPLVDMDNDTLGASATVDEQGRITVAWLTDFDGTATRADLWARRFE